jgi:hypothetical protein
MDFNNDVDGIRYVSCHTHATERRSTDIRNQAFWIVTSCQVVSGVSKDITALIVKVQDCLTLKMKALRSFESSGTTHSTTKCHITEHLNPQSKISARTSNFPPRRICSLQISLEHTTFSHSVYCTRDTLFGLTNVCHRGVAEECNSRYKVGDLECRLQQPMDNFQWP